MGRCYISDCAVYRVRWGPRTTLLLIELSVSDGVAGLGEASMSGDDAMAAHYVGELFEQVLRGRPATEVPKLIEALSSRAGAASVFCEATAASALEQALWDIQGQLLNVPIHTLLGGGLENSVPLYANINRMPGERTCAMFAQHASGAREAGFHAVKCAPFDEVLPAEVDDGSEGLGKGLDRVAAVRAAVGGDCALMVDCHGRLGERRAREVMPPLRALSVKWLEEPILTSKEVLRVIRYRSPEADEHAAIGLAGLRSLARDRTIPLAGGEMVVGLSRFIDLLQLRVLDFIMPDVKYCGGILTASRVGAIAGVYGARVTPHNPSGPVATLGAAHVAVVSATLDSLEVAWGELIPDRGLVDPPLRIEAGALVLPEGPGLGARLVPDTLQRLSIPLDADFSYL